MTPEEFSDQFDVLYNNITSNQAPGLDEYEKSVFLTKAQDDIIKSYFDPRLNKSQLDFEGNRLRDTIFGVLIKYLQLDDNSGDFTVSGFDNRGNVKCITSDKLPKDLMITLNESITVERNSKRVRLAVIPITYTDYERLMSKPYKRPNRYQAWRLSVFVNGNSDTNPINIEIIPGPKDEIKDYNLRYIKRPKPIITADLGDDISIGGLNTKTACELNEAVHNDILQRAVELAKAAYVGDLQSQVALGSASQTNLGGVSQK